MGGKEVADASAGDSLGKRSRHGQLGVQAARALLRLAGVAGPRPSAALTLALLAGLLGPARRRLLRLGRQGADDADASLVQALALKVLLHGGG